MQKIKNIKDKSFFLIGMGIMYIILFLIDTNCLIHYIFKIPCPGCNMTTAFLCLLRLDFVNAFHLHPMVWSAPILFLYFLFDGHLLGQRVDTIVLTVIILGFIMTWLIKIYPIIVS